MTFSLTHWTINRYFQESVYLLMASMAVVSGGCHLSTLGSFNPSSWFLKSVKSDARGDVITLLHSDKIYVARCKGEKYLTDEKIYLDSRCPYLTQHVGAMFEDGEGIGQISRPMSDIEYYRETKKQSYEIWEVVEETAK